MVGTSMLRPRAAMAVSTAAVRMRRFMSCSLRRLLGVEHVAGGRAVAGVLVAGALVERGLELVAMLLSRVVGAELDLAVLDRQRAERQGAVVLVAARRRLVDRAVRAVQRGELAAVDDADDDLRRELDRVVVAEVGVRELVARESEAAADRARVLDVDRAGLRRGPRLH